MRRFKFVSSLLFILIFSAHIFATAQAPDKVIYDGKEYSLHSNPMEDYFRKFPEKKPKTEIISTALWRGYIATFEFVDKILILKDIQITVRKKGDENSFATEWKSVISGVVPEGEKLKIDWMSGILVLPYGKIVNYVHMGYGSTYENYILLEVASGELLKSKEFGYKEYDAFKQRQFEAFKKTEEYKKLADDLKKDGRNEKFIDSFLRNFVIEYSSKLLID